VTRPVLDLFEDYLEVRSPEKLSEHTIRRYRTEAESIARHIAVKVGRPIDQITDADLIKDHLRTAFAAYARTGGADGKGHGKSSIAGAWSTWNGFFDHLVHDGLIEGNPMAAVGRPRLPKRTPKVINGGTDTVTRMIDAAQRGRGAQARDDWPERDAAVLVTLSTTAVRRAELVGLNIGSLDRGGASPRLNVVGKGGKERWVPAPAELLDALAEMHRTRLERFPTRSGKLKPDAPMFVGRTGERLKDYQVRYIVDAAAAGAGAQGAFPEGAHVHAFRHTAATEVAPQASATTLQAWLGHASLNTTQGYVGTAEDAVFRMVEDSPMVQALRHHSPTAEEPT
jgi:integrase/recombinase XerC